MGGHLGVDLGWFIDELHLENQMTVRKGIPRQGKHCIEPLRDKMEPLTKAYFEKRL